MWVAAVCYGGGCCWDVDCSEVGAGYVVYWVLGDDWRDVDDGSCGADECSLHVGYS